MKAFIKKINQLNDRYTIGEVFSDFLTISANSLANSVDYWEFSQREQEYHRLLQKYGDEKMAIFRDLLVILMKKIHHALQQGKLEDFFSQLFMEGFSDGQKGQFFTPLSVSQFMSDVTLPERLHLPIITQTEMSCGAGAMIIATANTLIKHGIDYRKRLLVECGDLDLRCVQMCYIQLFLYGIPAVVSHKNGLTHKKIYTQYRTGDYIANLAEGIYNK